MAELLLRGQFGGPTHLRGGRGARGVAPVQRKAGVGTVRAYKFARFMNRRGLCNVGF